MTSNFLIGRLSLYLILIPFLMCGAIANASSQTQVPPSPKSDRNDQALEVGKGTPSNVLSNERTVDIFAQWEMAEHAYRRHLELIRPPQTTGELIETGQCSDPNCKSGFPGSQGNSGNIGKVLSVTARVFSDPRKGTSIVQIDWAGIDHYPSSARFSNIKHYEVFLAEQGKYWIYKVDELESWGGPAKRTHTGARIDRSNGDDLSPGGAHSDNRRVRQSLRVVDFPGSGPTVRIRPVRGAAKGKGEAYHQTSHELDSGGGTTEATTTQAQTKKGQAEVLGEVDFKDPALKGCIYGHFQYPEEMPIADIKKLKCDGYHVKALGGIEALWALQALSLNANPISSINELSTLSLLRGLDLSDTEITDVGPLWRLTELESIRLTNTAVRDLAPLMNLNNLETVVAVNSRVFSVPDFSATSITDLDLSHSPLRSIDELVNALTLETFTFRVSSLGAGSNGAQAHRDQPFGDLHALIELAGQSGSSLGTVILEGATHLNCAQLDMLETQLGAGGGGAPT